MGMNGLMFTPNGGGAAGSSDFIKDAFYDISLDANSNGSLTSTSSTNPLNLYFNNTDQPLYGAKLLWFSNFELVEDRTKWISNQPTYFIRTHETFPSVQAYAFGDIEFEATKAVKTGLIASGVNAGFGVTGKIRRLVWILGPSYVATATAQLKTDGSNTTTADFSTYGLVSTQNWPYPGANPAFRTVLHNASNETNNLHDYQITALQNQNLIAYGVIVYFENATSNIEVQPGTTYVNKQKITTTGSTVLPLLSSGSSLGGVASIYKIGAGITQQILSAPYVSSVGQGSSGTNLISVSTGHGSSFPVGTGVVLAQGTSNYVGVVTNVSTDTLTVSPTLSFGLSNTIYTAFRSAPTLVISPTLMVPHVEIDFNRALGGGFRATCAINYYDFDNEFNYSLTYMGVTTQPFGVDRQLYSQGSSGRIVIQGNFQAAEVEFIGVSGNINNWTVGVDGLSTYSISAGLTGTVKHTLFTNAGPGWHSVVLSGGASLGTIGIKSIRTFQNAAPGITYGVLSNYTVPQAITNRGTQNSSLIAFGLKQRNYAEHLYLKGGWSLSIELDGVFNRKMYGTTTTALMNMSYYGRHFALIGSATAATLTVDGTGTPLTFNSLIDPGTEGFHTINLQQVSGATITLQAVDVYSSSATVKDVQNFDFKTYLQKPIAEDKVVCLAFATSGATFDNNSFVNITFNEVIVDNYNINQFSVSGSPPTAYSLFRVPKDGNYLVITHFQLNSSAAWNSASENITIYLSVNDINNFTTIANGRVGTFAMTAQASFVLPLKKNDLFTLAVNQNSGSNISQATDIGSNYVMVVEL